MDTGSRAEHLTPMRNLLVFVCALLLGGAAVFVLRNRQEETRETTELARPLEGERVGDASVPPAAELAPEPAAERSAERAPAQPTPEPARTAPLPSSLSGTLVVVDEHGGEHAAEDGILALGLGRARARREVEVRGGRWELTLVPLQADEPQPTLVLHASILGQRVAAPATGQATEFALPADGKVALRMHWPAAPKLHVRARDGGRELEQVFLHELPAAQRGSPLDRQHPGPDAEAKAAGPSPVALEPDSSASFGATRVVFAKSPGYAWGRIELDPGLEQPTLTLDPAGALELAVVGEPELTTLEILLLAAEPPHAEVLVLQRGHTKTFQLEDLRAGRYRAEARRSGLLVGALDVEVVAGERVQAELEVAQPTGADVPLEGVLVLPEEYGLEEFMLEFLLQGRFDDASLTRGSFEIRSTEMTREPGSPGRFRWQAPAVAPGRYRIQVFGVSGFVAELDSGSNGTRDALIEVPRPALVSVRCLDADTGAEVTSEPVLITVLGAIASQRQGVSPNPPRFQVPCGRIVLFTKPVAYEPAVRVVELGPGTNEILLQLRKKK